MSVITGPLLLPAWGFMH